MVSVEILAALDEPSLANVTVPFTVRVPLARLKVEFIILVLLEPKKLETLKFPETVIAVRVDVTIFVRVVPLEGVPSIPTWTDPHVRVPAPARVYAVL